MDLKLRQSENSEALMLLRLVPCELDLANNVWSLKNKHTTAQSSTLQPGYFIFHARTARFTSSLAAVDRFLAEATIFTTSAFVKASQTCKKKKKKNQSKGSVCFSSGMHSHFFQEIEL